MVAMRIQKPCLIFALVALSNLVDFAAGQSCFVPGQCENSELLTLTIANSSESCLNACKTSEGCTWMSFHHYESSCFLYKSCTALTEENCDFCISAERTCKPIDDCDIIGFCKGILELAEGIEGRGKCLSECRRNPNCVWMSHSASTKTCALFSTCTSIDESATDFTSSRQECPITFDGVIMVATGYPSARKTEVIDPRSDDVTCQALEDYPLSVAGATGALIDEQFPLICGGYSGGYRDECYVIGTSSVQATLLYAKRYASNVAINSTHLLIMGGIGNSGRLKTTEVVSIGQKSVAGPDLPHDLYYHCSQKINDTTAILIGGDSSSPSYEREVWFLDLISYKWTAGPSLKNGRRYHACSTFEDDYGNTFVIASGGENAPRSVEILNVNGQNWIEGPDLPYDLEDMAMLPSPDGKGVIIMGGYNSGGQKSDFLKLSCNAGLDCKWSSMNQKLAIPRDRFVAMYIPSSMAQCEQKAKLDHFERPKRV